VGPPPPPPPDINPNVEIKTGGPGSGRPVPRRRSDCRLSNYIYRGGVSYCTAHPINACPFGVETAPWRLDMPWWKRLLRSVWEQW
jgi:hypothetical protein